MLFIDKINPDVPEALNISDVHIQEHKPYMQNLDTLYTDATCYESEMRYPTDPKLLRESTS